MGKQEELIKLDRIIKDTEVRSRTFSANISVLEAETGRLLILQKQIEENIACLKNKETVPIASEYKKAKEEVKRVKTRISQLKTDLTSNKKALDEVEAFLKKNKESYDALNKQDGNNILKGRFGKNRAL